jgi:hypothetical protein
MDVSVQRQVVALLLELTIQPTRRALGFDPASVQTACSDQLTCSGWRGSRRCRPSRVVRRRDGP